MTMKPKATLSSRLELLLVGSTGNDAERLTTVWGTEGQSDLRRGARRPPSGSKGPG